MDESFVLGTPSTHYMDRIDGYVTALSKGNIHAHTWGSDIIIHGRDDGLYQGHVEVESR